MSAQGLGFNCRLYYKSGSYILISSVRDVTVHNEVNADEASPRDNGGFKGFISGWVNSSVSFEMVWDTTNAGQQALKTAFFNGTEILMAIMDDNIGVTGAQGLEASFVVTKFDRLEPLGDTIKLSVEIMLGINVLPAWVTI